MKVIQDNKVQAEERLRLGREITQDGQGLLNLADASLRVLRYVPFPEFDNEKAYNAWELESDRQRRMAFELRNVAPYLHVGTPGGTAAFVMADLASPKVFSSFQPSEVRREAFLASEQLSHEIGKLADKEKVLPLLRQFQLDKATDGNKSPLDLFETAWAAYERPASANSVASTSLIPMRECINETIKIFLRHRPKQEITKNERSKIISIGNQLFYDILPKDIESFADQWNLIGGGGLLDGLSGSKSKDVSREAWLNMLRRATLFLRDFLQSIDPKKLR